MSGALDAVGGNVSVVWIRRFPVSFDVGMETYEWTHTHSACISPCRCGQYWGTIITNSC
jgi:hypothetical protein